MLHHEQYHVPKPRQIRRNHRLVPALGKGKAAVRPLCRVPWRQGRQGSWLEPKIGRQGRGLDSNAE